MRKTKLVWCRVNPPRGILVSPQRAELLDPTGVTAEGGEPHSGCSPVSWGREAWKQTWEQPRHQDEGPAVVQRATLIKERTEVSWGRALKCRVSIHSELTRDKPLQVRGMAVTVSEDRPHYVYTGSGQHGWRSKFRNTLDKEGYVELWVGNWPLFLRSGKAGSDGVTCNGGRTLQDFIEVGITPQWSCLTVKGSPEQRWQTPIVPEVGIE